MPDTQPHPSESMTERNRVRYYLLAHTYVEREDENDKQEAIKGFFISHQKSRVAAYEGLKKVKGMKDASEYLEKQYAHHDQMIREMQQHQKDSEKTSQDLERLMSKLGRQLGEDVGYLPTTYDPLGQAELWYEHKVLTDEVLRDPQWHRYHNQAMELKSKMEKAHSVENEQSLAPIR